jgi:hypothetical protein
MGREAHPANVKVREAGATLIEDMIKPGQLTLAGAWITFAHEPIHCCRRQAVTLEDDNSLNLAQGSKWENY